MPKDKNANKQDKKTVIGYILLAVLVALLAILIFLLARDFRIARSSVNFGQNRLNLIELLHRLKQTNSITDKDVDFIDSWMTFSYVDTVFNLPSDYLQNQLKISNSSYPDITLAKYSRNAGLDRAMFIARVKKAVKDYLDMPKAK